MLLLPTNVIPLFATLRDSLLDRREMLVDGGREPLSAEARAELDEIDAALARIENGSYGHCERCGGAIGRQRLRAVPAGRTCTSCSSSLSEGTHP